MEPFLAVFAEFWWIGPTVIGAGALGWFGLRGQRGTAKARRLAYDASREALRTAQQEAQASRHGVRVARAELARAQAARTAGYTGPDEVAAARRALDAAQRDTRAAAATLRARRANLSADRAALAARSSDPAHLPLARVMAADDAVTARWMEYETDAARQLAFPAMSDARVPQTAAFLAAHRTARALRPAAPTARITPAQFGAYRDAVARLHHAFEAAEAEAWRRARAAGSAPAGPGPDSPRPADWVITAQEIAQNLTQTVLARGAEALARATAPRPRDGASGGPDGGGRGGPRDTRGDDRDDHA
ncbi:MAG: hypothetical protein J0I43_05505 [Microbacterium sp.]|uniref:hypothetical protein n=1 Tax=Microbacterium sp. TaxID=51671 RepID=UPI001AD339E1|nr:hypothetical protein [Microbacterium sp.]MBN9176808.1 hypothetical protein [Microbacterium sp.]